MIHYVNSAVLLLVLTQSISMLGQSKCSPCCATARLVSTVPGGKALAFSLHVSLRSYSPAKSDAGELNAPAKAEVSEVELSSRFESVTNATAHLGDSLAVSSHNTELKISPATRLPALLLWLRGWRMEKDHGLYRPLQNGASRLAIAYSDIFETRANPDKGSHGMSILFRYDVGRNARWPRSRP